MPTGYTSDLYQGKDQSFEDFVLSCARGFGAFIHQRDDSMSDKPTLRAPDTYYVKNVAKAEADLAEWERLVEDEVYDRYNEYVAKTEAYNKERTQKDSAVRDRYGTRLAEVEAWNVPPTLQSLKDFMIEQIKSSIQFDCPDSRPSVSEPLSFHDWQDQQEAELVRDVKYYSEQLEKEVQRVKEQNVYTFALYNALGMEP